MKPLIQALARASLNFTGLSKDGTGQVSDRKYQYMTLDSILAVVRPALAAEGLFLWHDPKIVEGILEVHCHVSDGEYTLSNKVPMPIAFAEKANRAQAMGSLLTYGKRYSLCALLSIGASEDDDAQATDTAPESKPIPAAVSVPRIVPRNESEAPRIESDDPILKGKLDWCKRKFEACGVRSEDRPAIIAAAMEGKDMPELAKMISACTTEGQRA